MGDRDRWKTKHNTITSFVVGLRKGALNDLVVQTRSASASLQRQIAQHQKAKGTNAAAQLGKHRKELANALFERGGEKATPVESHPMGSHVLLKQLDAPVMLTGLVPTPSLQAAVDQMEKRFLASKKRDADERAEMPLPEDAAKDMQDRQAALFDGGSLLDLGPPVPTLNATAFAVKQKSELCNVERGRAVTMRWSFKGTRQLMVTKASGLSEYLGKKGSTDVTPDVLKKYFGNMSSEQVDSYVADGYNLYHLTVGPGDLVILPFDALWSERAAQGQDVIGVRLGVFFKSDQSAVEQCSRWLISVSAPSEILSRVSDAYALLDS